MAYTPSQAGSYNTLTGTITPYIPVGGQTYNVPTSFEKLPMPKTYGEPIKLESGFPGVAPLNFDFTAEQQKAYEQLKPFYDKLLSFAGGDMDLALRILDYTYKQGMRESSAEHGAAVREQAITFPQEKEALQTEQNRRGILTSGFGATARGRLSESQALRREAIDRALADRESRLSADLGFGKEEKYRGFESGRFNLERSRQQEARNMALDTFGIKKDIWGAQLNKASLEEQRKTQQATSGALAGIYGGSAQPASMDARWLREHGYQSYLDELGRKGINLA